MIFECPIETIIVDLLDQLLIEFKQLKDIYLIDITFDIVRASIVKASVDENPILFVWPSSTSKPVDWVEFEPLQSVCVIDF